MITIDTSTTARLLHLLGRMESTLGQLLTKLDVAQGYANSRGGHAPPTLAEDAAHWERVRKWLEQGRDLIDV